MAEDKIRLTRPFLPQSAMNELLEVLEGGYWTQGVKVAEFERLLADYLGIDHVIVVSSGTAALHLAISILNLKSEDEVIIPAYSFAATANIVKICGARPVFVDVNNNDWCLDTSLLEEAINSRTKVVMPVQEFGSMTDMDSLSALSEKYNLHIVEDAACALGSEYKGKKAGTIGELGCFSFHPRKIITTGEGGAVVTNNEELADRLRMLRNHGCIAGTGIARKLESRSHGGSIEQYILSGYNYRMTDIQAVLGIEQLKTIEETIKLRQKQATFYDERFSKETQLQIPKRDSNTKHTYQSYHLLLKQGTRDALRDFLRSKKIESNIGAQYLPGLNCIKEDIDQSKTCPVSLNAYQNGIVLPIGRHINFEQLEMISKTVIEFVNGQI